MSKPRAAFTTPLFSSFASLFLVLGVCLPASAQDEVGSANLELYHQLQALALGTRNVHAENLVLHKDRAIITFRDGTIYFPVPVAGKVRGAVFVGAGSFSAATPPT